MSNCSFYAYWDNIKMDYIEVEWENVNWIHLVQVGGQALLNAVIKPSGSAEGRAFLNYHHLSRKTLIQGSAY